MSINLLETVQKNLGYPSLQKIDPNTQAVVEDIKTPDEDKFSQAAIPAILTAFYKYVQSDDGAAAILRGDYSTDWVKEIFEDNKREVVQTIASYSKISGIEPMERMNDIADETIRVTKESLPDDADIKDVKVFFNYQKNNILLYLPAALHIGDLLNDDTLDDNTNKMEGPISSLMHSIGSAFSKPVTEDELKNNK